MSELSAEAKALIRRVASSDGPNARDRERVRRRMIAVLAGVGTGLSTTTVAAGAPLAVAAAKTSISVASMALWFATGASLGAVVTAPVIVARLASDEAGESVRPADTATDVAPKLEPAPAEPVLERIAEPESGPAPAAPAAARATAATGSRASAPPGPQSLAEETRLLEAAQREMATGRAARALTLLDEHARRFPSGALGPERSAARVLALCALGRKAEATSVARAFVAAAPRSPLVPRLGASCAELDSERTP